MKPRARRLLGAVYFLTILAIPATVLGAEPPPVVVGEVGTRVVGSSDLPKELRRALEREIATLAMKQPARSKRFVLSASLVKLEHQTEAQNEAVSCTVSVVLREQKSGNIKAILEGRAKAQGNDVESLALAAAARAAVASLPEALR